jgi:von Willebrand factor type A domain/zinc-ribbon domain
VDIHGTRHPAVSLAISRRKYHPARSGEQELHAIVSVQVEGAGGGAAGPALAEVLVVDSSSSMDRPPEKFRAAKNAAVAALRMLPDGTPFAVVKGTHQASAAYPESGSMRAATPEVRAQAERAVYRMVAAGGTCVGSWLDLARRLLADQSAPIPHVLMLTDGRNEHDDRMPLAGVLDACEGQFTCDAWGIGDGWDARSLLAVVRRLHGAADAVHEEDQLPGEYRRLVGGLLAKSVPELVVRVSPAPGARVRYLKQVFPTELPLSQRETPAPGRPADFTTRAWGDELRRYQLCLVTDAKGRPRGEDLQAATVEVVLPDGLPDDFPGAPADRGAGARPGAGRVLLPPPRAYVMRWTDDPALSDATDDLVEHFELYGQLAQAVVRASHAYHRGRADEAAERLGVAVTLAHRLRAARQMAELERLVEVLDPAAGRVVLRPGVQAVDFEYLITVSTHSDYDPEPGGAGADPVTRVAAELTHCPDCGARVPADADFCPRCGNRFEAS